MFEGLDLTVFVIPFVVLVILVALFAVVRTVARNWITVPPNAVAVVFGRRYGNKGYRVVTGGGFFRLPIIESVQWVDLSLISFAVVVKDVPDRNGVLVSVDGIANVKISSDEGKLLSAIERFLGRPNTEIERVAKENLEANLRGIVGTLTVEQLIGERGEFMSRVKTEAAQDLAALGLDVELFNIQNITDARGYIEALGRKQTAEVIKNAKIGEAQAQRDSDIETANALRAGSIAKAKAEEEISNADRERDVVRASNASQIQAEEARVQIRADQAAAEERAILNQKEVAADEAKVRAEVDLQDVIRQKNEAAEEATTIVIARKTAEAKVIEADGDHKAATMRGEALRIEAAKAGEGSRDKMTAESEGRKAQAAAMQSEKEAEAAGQEAMYRAEAAGLRERGLAEAAADRERGLANAEAAKAGFLAEAEGVREKAEAYRQLEESGKFMLVIENAPAIIESIGAALASVMTPAAGAIGEGLANVGNIEILDMGGNGSSGDGTTALGRFMNSPVDAVWRMLKMVNAYGMTEAVGDLLEKAGIDPSAMLRSTGENKIDVAALLGGLSDLDPADREKLMSALSTLVAPNAKPAAPQKNPAPKPRPTAAKPEPAPKPEPEAPRPRPVDETFTAE